MVARTARVRNERLAEAMARRCFSSQELAGIVGVDPRTIERWVDDRDRIPRAMSRHAIADTLEVAAAMLWPGADNRPQASAELLALYPSRTALPAGHVMSLLGAATERVDILALAGIWLWDAVADFGATLASKAAAGVNVRVCLGDPAGESARIRGGEEGIGDLLRSRCELAINYAQRWLADYPQAIRIHDTTLYASLLRFDDDVLVNWHLYGSSAAESPVLHVRRTDARGVADASLRSFERVWAAAMPASCQTPERRPAS